MSDLPNGRKRGFDAERRKWERRGHLLHHNSIGWECWAHDACDAIVDGTMQVPP